MSARSGKRFARNQERFVPKSQNPPPRADQTHDFRPRSSPADTASKANGPDDAAAASSSSSSSAAATAAASARVRMGKNGDWVSNRSHGGGFVKYLPQDEAVAAGLGAEDGALDPVESQRVVDLLNRELSRLLKMSPRDFWREVASDKSLHEFLDSYLQFRNRWYDFPHHGARGIVAGIIVGEFELSRRVFMVLYRISSNKDPGARTSDSLSAKEHGALLQEKKLLDLPKLLDICAIYGHENEELTRLLVSNAMKAQPTLLESLTSTASHFLNIMHTMYQRCNASLEVLFSSGGREDHGHSGLHADFLEVMDFINDAVGSLDAFVDAYKPAAVYFSCPTEIGSGNEELINTLARLHDSLLPSLQQGLGLILNTKVDGSQNSSGDMFADISVNFKMLLARIVKFGWKLLDLCYFSGELFEDSTPLPTATKMFPAKIDDPLIRGEILIQTFREIHEMSLHPETQSRGTFLQSIERNYNILIQIDSLRTSGWIFMDEEQFQYLLQIATSHTSNLGRVRNVSNPSPSNKVQMDEDAAIMESKISQIKDLFPDHGRGFLSACLEAYNHDQEEVIQRILEGTLHEDLLALDISLEAAPAPKSSMSLGRNDKGKGELVEPATTSSSSADLSSSNSLHSVGHGLLGSSSSVQPATSSYGRFMRKSKDHVPNLKYLDGREAGHSVKTATLAAQYEYEDEYDDSFDELGLSLVEPGFEETESLADNRISSLPGKSSDVGTARWQSQKKPQFYVKDGKNYSYKVSGSVAASSAQEAARIHLSQKELIHGLGRGGNVPFAGSTKRTESEEKDDQTSDGGEETAEGSMGGRGSLGSRGRGGRGRGGRNYFRKDRAAKKHFDSLTRF